MINAFDRKRMGDLVVKHMRYQNTTIALSFLALLAVSGCMPVRSSDTDAQAPGKAPQGAAGSTGTSVVVGANTAYYFNGDNKLVAVKGLTGLPRSIEVSESFANQDGMTLVLESTCEGMLTQGGDAIEMVGKARTVVYAMVGPTVLTILGVEDLTNVTSRIIDPLEALSEEEWPFAAVH